MPGAPESDTNLWDSVDHLMAFDILLLSCEGGETFNANPGNLETYLNQGGRAFASHFHYAWFSDKLDNNQGFTVPADWGSNLATWMTDKMGPSHTNGPDDGILVTTLNSGGGTFAKGQYLSQWLQIVGALGQHGVPAADLSIYSPRFNAVVGPNNTASQPWINDTMGPNPVQTMYFSFDTPVNAPAGPDGGPPNYCGRAVFSDLHVSGDPLTKDTPNSTNNGNPTGQPPPAGCDNVDLSPQEKALEFMLFDLSSCVISDMVTPPTSVPVVN
jgi:hypothetical protein